MATNKYENSPLAPPLPDKMKTTNQTRISRLKKKYRRSSRPRPFFLLLILSIFPAISNSFLLFLRKKCRRGVGRFLGGEIK